MSQTDPPQYLDLEHFPSARMVDQEARRNLSVFLLAAPTDRRRQPNSSRQPLRWVQEDQLGEHPPLERRNLQ